jgi:hypothetical protein
LTHAGITADQIAALRIGQTRRSPRSRSRPRSSGLIGCDRDRLYLHEHAVVANADDADAVEINPRKVFERMFGQGGTPAERLARTEEDRSILDAVHNRSTICSAASAEKIVTVTDYRQRQEVGRRIQVAGKEQQVALGHRHARQHHSLKNVRLM